MKVIYQGNHWTERERTTAEEDETALMERVSFLEHLMNAQRL